VVLVVVVVDVVVSDVDVEVEVCVVVVGVVDVVVVTDVLVDVVVVMEVDVVVFVHVLVVDVSRIVSMSGIVTVASATYVVVLTAVTTAAAGGITVKLAVAPVDSVVAEDVVVLAEDTHPTEDAVQGPRRSAIFPILFATSSAKKMLILPTWSGCTPGPTEPDQSLGVTAIPWGLELSVGITNS